MPRGIRSTSTSKSVSPKTKEISFEFFAPEAKKVAVSGSFNNWKLDATKLKKGKDGNWKISLPLEPGRYEYRYLVDGQWENEQKSAELVSNPFGTANCVLKVE